MLWRKASYTTDMQLIFFKPYTCLKSLRGGKTKDDIILSSWGAHIPFVLDLLTSIKDWKSS